MKLFQKLIKLLNKYKSKLIKFHYNGKNINLTGDNVTISSNNFNVDSQGNMTCNNATINGVVNASSGSFTGEINATSGSFTGTVNATSGTFSGTVNATSGTFDNCNVRGNCTVSGNSISTSSSERINDLYVLNLHGEAIEASYSIGTANEHGTFYLGNYTGQDVKIPVPISITVDSDGKVISQTWRRLVFKGGILVEVQSQW